MSKAGKGLNLVVILGSVRHNRMVTRVSKYVLSTAKKTTNMAITTLDPEILDPSCSLNRQPLHFLSSPEKESPSWLKLTNEIICKANGIIVLSSEYNGMMPPALLNTMNSISPASFRHKPVGVVTYTMGYTGAMRALTVLRPYLCDLGLICVPGYVPIPTVHEAIDEDGNCTNELIKVNMNNLIRNVEWYSRALHDHEKNGNPHVN